MKKNFTASVIKEGDWYIAQCLEIDVASQGETETEALENLREALQLHFSPPQATVVPEIHHVEVDLHKTGLRCPKQ